jgi:hypothetical protein
MIDKPAKWLHVEPNSYDEGEDVSRKGVAFHVFLSPYDLPEAVRGRYNETLRRFVIDFKYVTEEASDLLKVDAYVKLRVGHRSRRLYQIEVDVQGLGASQVALKIGQAIDQLPSLLDTPRLPTGNFTVAKAVIQRKQPELLEALTGST